MAEQTKLLEIKDKYSEVHTMNGTSVQVWNPKDIIINKLLWIYFIFNSNYIDITLQKGSY